MTIPSIRTRKTVTASKKPPPDMEGNLRGRMELLRVKARQRAQVEGREKGDYVRTLAKHM